METFVNDQPLLKSSPVRAFQAVFESPNWGINVLWLTVAVLLQSVFVGQIALFGWGAELIASGAAKPDRRQPDIDSGRLGDYITQGLWPFCVYFVVQLVGTFLVALPVIAVVLVGIAIVESQGEAAGIFIPLVVVPFVFVMSMLLALFTVPFLIRSLACQNFKESFDIAWVRSFVRLMFWEMVGSGIVFFILSIGVALLGFLMLCVGYIPAIGVISGAAMHLLAQWYEVFLSRGGDPVPRYWQGQPVIDATIV